MQERVGVNRRILNVAPSQNRQMLECKAARRGGRVITVELQDASMPTSIYGSVSDGPRKSRANFMCRDCGYEENADLNAARNIRFHALQARHGASCSVTRSRFRIAGRPNGRTSSALDKSQAP